MSGIGRPAEEASRILPRATADNAMSSTISTPAVVGTAIASGLLPTIRSAPPGAGISGVVFDIAIPMQPAWPACMAQRLAAPK